MKLQHRSNKSIKRSNYKNCKICKKSFPSSKITRHQNKHDGFEKFIQSDEFPIAYVTVSCRSDLS